jgi:hypothetical protein
LTVASACSMQTSVGTFEAEKLVESIRCYALPEMMLCHETCSCVWQGTGRIMLSLLQMHC